MTKPKPISKVQRLAMMHGADLIEGEAGWNWRAAPQTGMINHPTVDGAAIDYLDWLICKLKRSQVSKSGA